MLLRVTNAHEENLTKQKLLSPGSKIMEKYFSRFFGSFMFAQRALARTTATKKHFNSEKDSSKILMQCMIGYQIEIQDPVIFKEPIKKSPTEIQQE